MFGNKKNNDFSHLPEFRLADFYMKGTIRAKSEKDVIAIVSALSKLASSMRPDKLLEVATSINDEKTGADYIKKIQAYA